MIDLTFLTFFKLFTCWSMSSSFETVEFQMIDMGLQVHITTNDDHCSWQTQHVDNLNTVRQSKVSMIFDIRYSEDSNIANIKLARYSEITPGGGGGHTLFDNQS